MSLNWIVHVKIMKDVEKLQSVKLIVEMGFVKKMRLESLKRMKERRKIKKPFRLFRVNLQPSSLMMRREEMKY